MQPKNQDRLPTYLLGTFSPIFLLFLIEFINHYYFNMESTTTTATSKTNFLFVLTAPRSLSTVFLRSFLEDPSVTVFNDSVTTCKLDNSTGTVEENLQKLEDRFDETIRMGKTIVLKDMAFIVNEYFETIRRWNCKYNMKFMYLVHHPKAQFVSHEKGHRI